MILKNIDEKVIFEHTPSKYILTHEFYRAPSELPWAGRSIHVVQENNRKVDHINVVNLPESNHKEIPWSSGVL